MNLPLFLAQAQAQTPAQADASDIRDIRGVIAIPSSWIWLAWLVGTLALAVLIFAAWKWWRNRKKKIVPPDPLTVALGELEKARALLHPETAREFSITVSQTIRAYIESRFRVRSAQRTTEEFLHDLVNEPNSPLAPYRALLDDFLGHCDLAKFGRWELSISEMESMLQSARSFVIDTRPQPEPVAAASAK